MSKAIYANIDGCYHRVDQSTRVPTNIARMQKTTSKLEYNQSARTMTASIWLNSLEDTGVQSNRGLYMQMVDDLRKKCVTKINGISNKFLVYLDYSIYNENDKEINHSTTYKLVDAIDAILPLGVATNNENVFRRVKMMDPKIIFSVTNRVPFGVMCCSYGKKYTMKLNDVAILQSISHSDTECFNEHNSCECNSYEFGSHTICNILKEYIPVYSTATKGIEIGEFTVDFWPRQICIDLHFVLANLITAYDDQDINNILTENIDSQYPDKPVEPDPGPEDPDIPDIPILPGEDNKPVSDGSKEPDENGFYDFYELCRDTTPGALLVVEDDISDTKYNINTMIKLSYVIKDVPEIKVGEYVRYWSGFDITKL